MRRWAALVLTLAGFAQLASAAYIPAKAALAQVLLERAWAASESVETRHKPWPWADTWPVARLQSIKHDVDLIVLANMTGRAMAFGPAHMSASALPGNEGTSVIGGHRDTHFEFLEKLSVGDRLLVERANGDEHWFRVANIEVVDTRTSQLNLRNDGSWLTLITCYPFMDLAPRPPLRYVVTAERLPRSNRT